MNVVVEILYFESNKASTAATYSYVIGLKKKKKVTGDIQQQKILLFHFEEKNICSPNVITISFIVREHIKKRP